MAGNIYDTTTLLSVMSMQKVINPFYLGFFSQQINFTTEDIYFDKVSTDYRKLAPFVAPNVQGKPSKRDGYTGVSFKPAYVKQKDVIDPNMLIVRMPGEALGSGSMSPQQRYDATVAEVLRQHRTKLINRNEWMAARALIDGSVVIKGDDYPEVTVDFQRDASLNYALTGTARWNQSTAKPMDDLKVARLRSNTLSGARITRHVFGQNAWEYFASRVDLKSQMDTNYRGGFGTNVTSMSDGYEGQEYMGVVQGSNGAGRIEVWVDTSKYVDENGTEQFFLDQDTVVGFSDIGGVRCFGAIRDKRAGLQALEVFSKMWEEEDPSVEYLMSQSAPLMVPRNPNASFKIKVV